MSTYGPLKVLNAGPNQQARISPPNLGRGTPIAPTDCVFQTIKINNGPKGQIWPVIKLKEEFSWYGKDQQPEGPQNDLKRPFGAKIQNKWGQDPFLYFHIEEHGTRRGLKKFMANSWWWLGINIAILHQFSSWR
ncbi:hypothetical protein O181_011136 [Austropuccinia psidii MF-1]|uniref:Uncharacterized protein n=1 Tax=Austropuccinia psidii MF-1 TaxID=1389203 RepID=A0A9Q3BSB6_9BASI|nr:hypothetical protein [Austropuccinia psidii MF-1]